MKSYINQIYNEGFATTFYLKPIRYINKKIKNKKLLKFLTFIIKIVYTVLLIVFCILMFINDWPL